MREVELIEHRYCDLCNLAGMRTLSTLAYAIALYNVDEPTARKPRVLDTCDAAHMIDMAVLVQLLDTLPIGRTGNTYVSQQTADTTQGTSEERKLTPSATKKLDKMTCELCGRTMGRGNYTTHLIATHKCRPPAQPKKCPDCGKVFAPNGMIVHRARIHGYDYIALMVASAVEKGQWPNE